MTETTKQGEHRRPTPQEIGQAVMTFRKAIGMKQLSLALEAGVDERTVQPFGLLHGGASVALAETLGSTGAAMCVDAEKYQVVGQEINANHVRAARSGVVTGTARPAHIGGRTHVWTIDIVNDAGLLVCISRITMAVIKRGAL